MKHLTVNNPNERNARGKKCSSMKADLKKANRKIRRDKTYKNSN